jgi:hypothetical protein
MNVMKNSKFKMLFVLIVSLALFAGCNNDDENEEVSPYVGSYAITKATLTKALTLTTNFGPYTINTGTDITQVIQQALLSAITCTPDKSLIELKDDYSMLMRCEGTTNQINAGTWEEVSATVLKLNMNSAAIPSSPTGFVLTVNNVSLNNKVLSGSTNVPIPKEMAAVIVTSLSSGLASLDMAATAAVVPIDFSIELTQK